MKTSNMFQRITFLLLLSIGVSSDLILPEYENCDFALGMETGFIDDKQIRASSSHDVNSVGPRMSRIRTEVEGGAWCPSKAIGPNSYEYLEIELKNLFKISAIESQGRFDNGQGNEFAEYYRVEYQRDTNQSVWMNYFNRKTNRSLIRANLNTYLAEKRYLQPAFVAKRIRIIPFSSQWRTVCMRIEIYGCPFLGGIISYLTSPPDEQDRFDDGGIGKLTDGILGDDPENSLTWKKSPVTVDFEFDDLRLFKTIKIYSNREKYRRIEIRFDDFPSIEHRSSLVEIVSNVFIDNIDLDQFGTNFIGKQVQLKFHFDEEQLSLSEITFDNSPSPIRSIERFQPNTTRSNKGRSSFINNYAVINASSIVTLSPLSLSLAVNWQWLTIWIISVTMLFLILVFILCLIRLDRQQRMSFKQQHYSKSLSTTKTIDDSKKISSKSCNYDDMNSMGSYIYPITSSTSLLQRSSPSSVHKNELYAVIDANPSMNWPLTDTIHYASSEIETVPSRSISLFNCVLPREIVPSPTRVSLPVPIDRSKLTKHFLLSESQCGQIHSASYSVNNQVRSVIVKTIKSWSIDDSKERFLSEVNILSRLNNVHLVFLHGIDLEGLSFVQEHSNIGTLDDFYRNETNEQFMNTKQVYFAYQLSNALEYLFNLGLIHTDVAARNCLLYNDFSIRLTDCAMAIDKFDEQYWIHSNGDKIPLRWMSPETLITKIPTFKSDVYSFGVTLWQFWSHCSSLPHSTLNNEQFYQYIVFRQSSFHLVNKTTSILYLPQPVDCPKEIYDLLCECWYLDGTKRPSITDIALFFKRQTQRC